MSFRREKMLTHATGMSQVSPLRQALPSALGTQLRPSQSLQTSCDNQRVNTDYRAVWIMS